MIATVRKVRRVRYETSQLLKNECQGQGQANGRDLDHSSIHPIESLSQCCGDDLGDDE